MPAGASATNYDPRTWKLLTYHDAVARFLDGSDSPRAYLERSLEAIEAREDDIMAWAFLDSETARASADKATERYRTARPLSPVDGLPIGIKDLMTTFDMPTEYGSVLYKDHRPLHDAACVDALRQGGAVLVGKTVTITFGGGDAGRTRNPHDTRRTPGGSSSGSAAAVGAATIPGAIGTHARGSTIRPASFCGTYALKPTYGAINRQGVFSAADSMDHIGTFAGSLDDMWIIARHMAAIAGGDPGHPGLYGAATPPEPLKPARLIRLDTAGWAQTDEASKAGFERIIAGLAAAGVTIHARRDDPTIDTFEDYLAEMPELWRSLYRFEMRWPLLQYRDRYPDQIPPRLLRGLEEGAGLTQAEYRDALVRRAYVRGLHRELANRVDGFITLSSPGPGPIGSDQGSAIFNEPSSVLGAPAISLPMLGVEDAPVGIQLLGQFDGDAALTARAQWIAEMTLADGG